MSIFAVVGIALVCILLAAMLILISFRQMKTERAVEDLTVVVAKQGERVMQISTSHNVFVGEIREVVRQGLIPVSRRILAIETQQTTIHNLLLEMNANGLAGF